MDKIISQIEKSVDQLISHKRFINWLETENVDAGDLIFINNSFVYRDVSTNKSDRYLTLKVSENGSIEKQPYITSGLRFNNQFKLYKSQSSNLPTTVKLSEAIEAEIEQLGSLIFILIGQVDDSVIIEHPISIDCFDLVIWNPNLKKVLEIEGSKIFIRDTHDEETIWDELKSYFVKINEEIPEGLREALGVALDKLQDRAEANLILPTNRKSIENCITDSIIKVLEEQQVEYSQAFSKCKGDFNNDSSAYNEILRIAYNFASDATTYLKLIVSICDLKPLILWGTIFEHYQLSESFRKLPWTRSRNKPSLKNYTSIIGDARNSAFHNLFPFRKSLNLHLPDKALQNANIRIFSEHGKKKENRLAYIDKELVDVLLEFTRSRDRRASARFWQQNIEVMENTIAIFEQTSSLLKKLLTL